MSDLRRRLDELSPADRERLRDALRSRRPPPAPPTGGPVRRHAQGDPLIAAAMDRDPPSQPRAIFLGFGLTTRHGVSVGRLPFDSLAMVMVAEAERRKRGAEKVMHLIADEHAMVNDFAEADTIDRAASAVERELRDVVAAFGYEHYEVFRASAIDDDAHLELLLLATQRCRDPYAAQQAADVEWARRTFGATVKIGWVMDPRPNSPARGFDERYFDQVYSDLFGAAVTAIYCYPGRTLDPDLPRASPYTLLPGQLRLSLTATEQQLQAACVSRSMSRHLRVICQRAEVELGLAGDGELIDRITAIMQRLAGPAGPPVSTAQAGGTGGAMCRR
jgi:hypothetical protein